MVKAGFRRKDIRGVLKASFLIAIGTLLVSCKNPLYEKQDSQNQTEKVKVCISTDLQNKNERSVLPTNEFDESTQNLKWTLVGSLQNGVQNKLLGVWEDSDEKTAYQKMTSAEADSEILLDVGIWNFTLTVTTEIDSIEKNVLVGTKNNVEISATKENTLFFKMKAASGEDAANGQIEFLLNFPENIISNAEVSLFSYSEAGIAEKPLGTYSFSAAEGTQTISQVSFNESVAPGTYALKIKLFQKDFSEAIHTYSCIVNVVPLLKSSGEVTLSNLAQLYRIEYQLNEGSFESATINPNAYNSYTTFELPTVTREGYTFIGWFKGEEKIERTEYSISEDTVLTAKWAKNVDGIAYAVKDEKETLFISSAQGLAIFRDSVNILTESIAIPLYNLSDGSQSQTERKIFTESPGSLNAELLNDINLAELKDESDNQIDWIPISNYQNSTFNGNNHTISNLLITHDSSSDIYGLFGTVKDSIIKNVIVSGKISVTSASFIAGIVANVNNSEIDSCVSNVEIICKGESSNYYVAGISAFSNDSNITNCVNLGNISADNTASLGGIVGVSSSGIPVTINKCINLGDLSGNEDIAGICGLNYSSNVVISNCANLGTIGNDNTPNASGVATQLISTSLSNCLSVGTLQGVQISPFVSNSNNCTITDCYFDKSIISSTEENGKLTYEFATGEVFADSWVENWSFEENYYPLPNLQDKIPSSIGNILKEKAKIENLEIGSQGNPYTNWSELKEYLETEETTESTIYIAGEIEATEKISVARPVVIKSVGEVKIIKGTSNIFNFESDTSFSLIGTENNRIIFDGKGTESLYEFVRIYNAKGNFIFDYCTFQNANYSSYEAAVLYAEGFSQITMNNCIITNNQTSGYIIQLDNSEDESTSLFELNNCEISENVSTTTDEPLILQIAYCDQVKINNTKFDQNSNSNEGNSVYDIYVEYVSSLNLAGNIQIPNLYFNNSSSGPQPYSLDMQIEENFSLLDSKIPICVEVYETTQPTTGTRDLDLFDLQEGQTVPENVFVLANDGYQINAETGEIEEKINSPQTGESIETNDFVYVEGSTISTVLNPASEIFNGTEITIRSLYVCNHEVTQKEYTTYCEYGASDKIPSVNGVGDNYPAYFVNFFDALAYCNNRSIAENLTPCYKINDYINPEDWGTVPSSSTDINGIWANENIICNFEATGYRLLTEEEWEYVARGGKNLDTFEYSGSNTFTDVGFSSENCEKNTDGSTKMTSEIKQKATNSLGIYDMSGNVGEWTWGVNSSTARYVRGGSILQPTNKCTVYERTSYGSYSRNYYTGFRICRNAE